jgi:hypothetical protein
MLATFLSLVGYQGPWNGSGITSLHIELAKYLFDEFRLIEDNFLMTHMKIESKKPRSLEEIAYKIPLTGSLSRF